MFKKHKQLIIGFILGALLFSIVPVSAVVQEYILKPSKAKITVDGEEFKDDKLPILYYEGYNYIPAATFREICGKIGVSLEWVEEKDEIQINTKKTKPIEKKKPLEGGEDNMENVEYIEKDGYDLIAIDGIEYIAYIDIKGKLPDGYKFDYEPGKNRIFVCTYDRNENGRDTIKSIILDNIPHILYEQKTWIEYDYYIENIVTLSK